jgi:hypothetical protein
MVLLILIAALSLVAIAAAVAVTLRDGYRRSPLAGTRTLER